MLLRISRLGVSNAHREAVNERLVGNIGWLEDVNERLVGNSAWLEIVNVMLAGDSA